MKKIFVVTTITDYGSSCDFEESNRYFSFSKAFTSYEKAKEYCDSVGYDKYTEYEIEECEIEE